MPINLPNRNVYMAFNFEANYGFPTNDSYYYWVDRVIRILLNTYISYCYQLSTFTPPITWKWNLDKEDVGVGNNVTNINNLRRSIGQIYTRNAFYRSIVGYLDYYDMNGTGCLLRTICDVSASNLDEHNGLLGSIFKILFM